MYPETILTKKLISSVISDEVPITCSMNKKYVAIDKIMIAKC